ncbi:hypothetical protein HBH1_03214 [Herbaspirillum sp. BH-1]|jgi:cytochrome c oxidase cbb3-type subunit 4|uniref:Cytochrome c oxidase cbb3-type subunit 4 n=1 Tax=Herbaspirillum frisingense TaxID=92645 RepID=A0ABU1PDB8_9BURK|nr:MULTISPECIES: cbb3-type cytochrome c oxidase subunit 3 [Herbaspirillum]MDR6583906.1 cytochrome c oxidase cbb3-type subunit 4 [Herbaspirillum frisingense]PLY58423.1 hypothetical protein HBH1_03214 [Herbaspirillum sp. BH-1]QNB08302.1 CcoQ/FixQ family Cbb3-type cytochrome c oxidase assembly chaperone [Herbaspirillum frisingense]
MIEMITDPRSLITLISFITFAGILWWTYVGHKPADFKQAEMIPFADGDIGQPASEGVDKEVRHG